MKFIGLVGNCVDYKESINSKNDKVLVFDIDNTLYKETKEIITERRKAGYNLLKDELNISFDEFYRLSDEYTNKYGTNYKGFILNNKIKPSTIEKINDVDAELKPFFSLNQKLINLLKSLPFKIYYFSNGNLGQARNTLINLGLEKIVDYVFYVKYVPNENILCKPSLRAYEVVDEVIRQNKKNKVLFFDDNLNNIQSANQFGWIGIEIKDYDQVCESITKALRDHFDYEVSN